MASLNGQKGGENLPASIEGIIARLSAELKQCWADTSEVGAESTRLAALYQDDADAVCEALGVKWTPDNKYPTVALDAIAQLQAELTRTYSVNTGLCADLTLAEVRLNKARQYSEGLEHRIEILNQLLDGSAAELAQARQDAQDQSDEVQELWLSPCEAEGLKRQLEQAEAQIAAIKQAVEWLWGFWDGNSLVAIKGFDADIAEAWDRLLKAADTPIPAQLLDRLAEAEQELKQRQRQIDLLSGAELRAHQAGRRTENLQQEKVGVHEVLDECQIPRNYDDGKPASARTRIFWLNRRAERAEALAALVNEETAALLERLAACAEHVVYEYNDLAERAASKPIAQNMRKARELAAKIREALEAEK